MEYNIRAYVDELFREAPDSQRAFEMKEELTQNLIDKYNDLVASGKSEKEAYDITVYGIGDISELLEQMYREEPALKTEEDGESPIFKAVLTSFWPLLTAIYFLLSFWTGRWEITWVIFVAAPALRNILSAVLKKK